eukprot:m.165188 g.165188  ORF g.165188 m.165188 type:complete len:900 (+) comp18127_c0_seq1:535-3234(+)
MGAEKTPESPEDGIIYTISQIGPYRLGKKLGEGAFAVVREGKHLITDVDVACKVFDKTAMKDDYVVKNLHREAEILRKLQHPHIIQLYEILETEDVYCLVMEVCAQDVLSRLCSTGVSSEVQARIYGRQLISAFEYMHHNNIVHRDLKAENMMLDKTNHLKIIDFGLSNDMSGRDFLDTQCGSMAYSAPELLACKPYGKAVDIWSIGVCLYVMLTGHLPFGNQDLTELHALMLEDEYELPDIMSDSLKDLFTRFFQVKPQHRITIKELWEHEWIRGLESPEPPLPLKPTSQRRPDDFEQRIIEQMVFMGFTDSVDIIESLCANCCNRATATYHLLSLKRRLLRARLARRGSARSYVARAGSTTSTGSSGSLRRARSDRLQPLLHRRSSNGNGAASDRAGDLDGTSSADGHVSATGRRNSGRSRRPSEASCGSTGEPAMRRSSSSRVLRSRGSNDSLSSMWAGDGGGTASPMRRSFSDAGGDDDSDAGAPLYRNGSATSRPGSRQSQRGSVGDVAVAVQFFTFPEGLDCETQSFTDVLLSLALRLQDSIHAPVDAELNDEIVSLTLLALRVAPDVNLLVALRQLGWTGLGFKDITSSVSPLLQALVGLDGDVADLVRAHDVASAETITPPSSATRRPSQLLSPPTGDASMRSLPSSRPVSRSGSGRRSGDILGDNDSPPQLDGLGTRRGSFNAADRKPLPRIVGGAMDSLAVPSTGSSPPVGVSGSGAGGRRGSARSVSLTSSPEPQRRGRVGSLSRQTSSENVRGGPVPPSDALSRTSLRRPSHNGSNSIREGVVDHGSTGRLHSAGGHTTTIPKPLSTSVPVKALGDRLTAARQTMARSPTADDTGLTLRLRESSGASRGRTGSMGSRNRLGSGGASMLDQMRRPVARPHTTAVGVRK